MSYRSGAGLCCNISEWFLTLTSHTVIINLVSHPQWLGSSKLEGEKVGAVVMH